MPPTNQPKRLFYRCFWLVFMGCCRVWQGVAQQGSPYAVPLNIENGMPSNIAHCLHQDKLGYIWIGTDKGLVRYDGEQLVHYSTEDGLTANEIFNILETPSGELILSTFTGGLSCCDVEGQCRPHPQNTLIQDILQGDWIHDWEMDANSNLYFTVSNRQQRPRSDTSLYFLTAQGIQTAALSAKQQFPLSVNCKIIRFSDTTFIGVRASSRTTPLFSPISDPKPPFPLRESHRVAVSDRQWLFVLDVRPHQQPRTLDSVQLPYHIHSFLQDQSGGYWVGTNGGVYYFADGKLTQQPSLHFFEQHIITDFLWDREHNLWISTLNAGVFRIPSLDIWLHQLRDVDRFMVLPQGCYAKRMDTVIALPDQTRIGNTRRFLRQLVQNPALDMNVLGTNKTIVTDSMHRIWIGSSGGLIAVDTLGQVLHDSRLYGFAEWVSCLAADATAQRVYVGTRDRIYAWDLAQGQFTALVLPAAPCLIEDMCLDAQGNLWVATNGQGLLQKKPLDHTFKQWKQPQGLPSLFVQCLWYDPALQRLWIGTNKGLASRSLADTMSAIQPVPLHIQNIKDVALYQGQLWCATPQALIRLKTTVQQPMTSVPFPVHLQQIYIKGNKKAWADTITLQPDEHDCSLRFKSISFRRDWHYQYRLVGLSEEWQTAASSGVQFNNLPPGFYVLEVKAATAQGVNIPPAPLLSIRVLPTLVQTWWFRGLLFILSLLLLVGIGAVFLHFYYRRTKTQLLIQSLQQKAIQSQMNPHFLFNALNSIQYLVTINRKQEAQQYISTLSKLLRQVLECSHSELITLAQEWDILERYIAIEQMRFGNKVQFILHKTERTDTALRLPPMLLQPLLENALVHGLSNKEEDGTLRCSFDMPDADTLTVAIEDDGVGRAAAQIIQNRLLQHTHTKTSIGLDNFKSRIENLNKIYPHFIHYTINDFQPDSPLPGTRILIRFHQHALV